MYGSTSNSSASLKFEDPDGVSESRKYGIYRVSDAPTNNLSKDGTIAIKAVTEISSFTVLPKACVTGTNVSSSPLFSSAADGAVFYLVVHDTGGREIEAPAGINPFSFKIGSGSQMYQKVSGSTTLIPVNAWMKAYSWKSLNY